jgi:hypothetical protein
MGGLPDLLIETGTVQGPNFGAAGLQQYQALWQTWQTILLQGMWGFKALSIPVAPEPINISWWQQDPNAPFNLDMVLDDAAGYAPDVGDIVAVRSVLMGVSGAQRPIGRWRVRSVMQVDPTHHAYELDQSSAYQAALVQEPGTVESVSYEYVAYATVLDLQQAGHKRGIGPVRPRGRQKRPVRRQPV